ncbi:NADH-quinone oxidoreductase subunit N [bacterium]|nr:NADH-quinone oxidoreductase subunit N [bacterium]
MNTYSLIKPELLMLTKEQMFSLMPYFYMFVGALFTIILSVNKKLSPKWTVFLVSLATCLVGISTSVARLKIDTLTLFNGMMISDTYSHLFNIIFIVSAGLTILSSFRYLDKEGLQHPEYNVLILLAALGMMLMTSSMDLIVLFISLEIMSLSVYVLVGFRRADRRSNEAAMKYFILGSAASAVLLYGTALLYGATGKTQIHDIYTFIQTHPQSMSPVFVLGAWLVILGFLFKVASVPFHMWMPDVYEGAPAPITGFMTTGLKAAAFAAFLRVFVSLGYGSVLSETIQTHLHHILWVCAVLTMVVGNVVALTQTNLKRMLAYSSIAHTGYLLIGLLAGPKSDQGYSPMIVYLVSYAVMNLGAFGVLTLISTRDDGGLNLNDVSGLSRRHPWLAFSMAVFLFSMAGVPPTAGFLAKYLLFYSAVQANELPIVIIGVLCSAVSVYYYLRVLVYMYMKEPQGSPMKSGFSVWPSFVVAAMVFLTLQIGLIPGGILTVARKAMAAL